MKDDESSNERRAALQSRQLDEQMALGRRLSGSNSREEALIEEFYGPSRKALKSTVQNINEKLQQPGVKGMLYRSLKGREAQSDVENAKRSMDNLDMRVDEMRQKLGSGVFSMQENLALKHDIQREDLEKDIHSPSIKPSSRDTASASISVTDNLTPNSEISKGRSR